MSAAEYLAIVQRTPEWIEARQHGIGASEAAAAAGMSRWESKYSLWGRKCRLVPPAEPTLAMEIGTLTEPLNAARYAEAVGTPVRRVNRLMRSRRLPFALASLDRRRADGRLVELKWSERAEGYGEPGSDEVPDEVACQVTHQMFVAGADCADVSLLTGSREGVRIYTVRWDQDFADALLEREAELWRHVEERTEPELDGSDATLAALGAMFPRENPSAGLADADADAAAALSALLDLRDAIARHTDAARELGKDVKPLRAVLERAIGEAPGLCVPGLGRVTWKAPRPSPDWKCAAAAVLKELGGPMTLEELGARHPGKAERRFLPSRDKEEGSDV